ncbi:MAG: alcohol dehydrogenase catalytic domain-containing protein [Phycisphaerales bacterium]|nr:MAG: alcohol dehydrogenase catalytic domain-containing protein [Phycisphaerales bacterium]
MKAVVLTGLRQMEIRDVPAPEILEEEDVLLKVKMVGICGSDLHYYETGRIGAQVVEYPFIIGHECSAVVEAVGRGVGGVKAGDTVVVDPAVACHECAQCKKGRENTCENLRFLGSPGQGGGCLCEYIVMPQECCFPVEGVISLEEGVLCEPLAIGLYSVERARMAGAADVAILGAGPIGLSCLLAAGTQQDGATCYVTEKVDGRMEGARRGGAAWVGNPDREDVVAEILQRRPSGVAVAFECAGQQETVDQAVDLVKAGGRVVLIGSPRTDRVSFDVDKIRRKEITIVNIRRQNKCTQKAIDLIASHKVGVDFMVTHRFEADRARDAFEMVAGYRDGVIKALIVF